MIAWTCDALRPTTAQARAGVGSLAPVVTRRSLLHLAPALPILLTPTASYAKPYSEERFSLIIPDGFALSKRTGTTGTIFVAGNFPRASVISVTCWPVTTLLEDDFKAQALPGIEPAPVPPLRAPLQLSDLESALGGTENLAKLLLRRRDRDSGALTSVLRSSEAQSQRVRWSATTELPVADPEELYKQRGVRSLVRKTTAASWLGSVGDQQDAVFSICASALEENWDEFGPGLEAAVDSFALSPVAGAK
jgi:hypothetical protein